MGLRRINKVQEVFSTQSFTLYTVQHFSPLICLKQNQMDRGIITAVREQCVCPVTRQVEFVFQPEDHAEKQQSIPQEVKSFCPNFMTYNKIRALCQFQCHATAILNGSEYDISLLEWGKNEEMVFAVVCCTGTECLAV